MLGGLFLWVNAVYHAPLAGKGRSPHGSGLYPELAVFGFYDGKSCALVSQVARQVTLLPSFALARQELARRGLDLNIKTVRGITHHLARQFLVARRIDLDDHFTSSLPLFWPVEASVTRMILQEITSACPGGLPCRVLLVRRSNCLLKRANASKSSSAPAPPRRRSSSAAASSCVPPGRTSLPIRTSRRNWTATATPSDAGANASSPRASRAFRTTPAPAGPGAFPPSDRLSAIALASSKTADHDDLDSTWTLDRLAFAFVNERANRERFLSDLGELERQAREDTSSDFARLTVPVVPTEATPPSPSRSTIWRILDEIDLKPHKSVYWLNSHDPDFDAKAQDICRLYLDAARLYEEGRLVLSSDEKTGMQALGRPHPTREAQPGKPAKVEFDYIRHGTRGLLTTFCVPTGKLVWDLLPTRTSVDWVAHLRHVVGQFPGMKHYDWVVDNLNTHWSLEVCRLVAELEDLTINEKELRTGAQRRAFLSEQSHEHVFHFTPIHGSWLNQVELFFSVLSRRFLRDGVFGSMSEFEERLQAWLKRYNEKHAHPYKWTYAGQPLVRGTPFSQTPRQQKQGRAWFGPRGSLFERLLYPPRPYKRRKPQVAANL